MNGVRLGPGERQLHPRDIVQFGKVAMMVELPEADPAPPSPRPVATPLGNGEQIIVEAEASSSWQEGFERLLLDRNHSPAARRPAHGPAPGRPPPGQHRE